MSCEFASLIIHLKWPYDWQENGGLMFMLFSLCNFYKSRA